MGRIIEAKAVISAEDRTGAVFDKIARKFREVGKSAKVSAEVDRLNRALKGAQDAFKGIDTYRADRGAFYATRKEMLATRAAAEETARAIAATAKPSRELEQQHRRNARAAEEAARAYERHKDAVLSSRATLARTGVEIGGLIREHARLGQTIDRTNAAIRRQHALGRAESGLTAGMGEAGRREHARIARDRYLIEGMGAAGREAIERREAIRRAQAEAREERRADRREAATVLGADAAVVAGHHGKQVAKDAITSAAEFDIAVRKQQVAADLSTDDQAALLAQAKKIGAETPFTNIDVVRAQTAAMQGLPAGFSPSLKAEVAKGILENVQHYSMLMDTDLKEGAEIVRSYLQATGKDISSKEKALTEANKATNQIFKTAKLGGMNGEDAAQYVKYAASHSATVGLSTDTMLTLGALARRGGLRGDEGGVAMRSMASKIASPTKKGLAALNAAGVNYGDFVRMPDRLSTANLEGQFRFSMGKGFTTDVRAKLDAINSDKFLLGDQGRYTEAVVSAVGEILGKSKNGAVRASDARVAAKTVSDFYKISAQSVDAEGLLDAAMSKKMSLAQLNAWLTDKHGGKGAITQRQWDEFRVAREEIKKSGDDPNYAANKSKYVMAGLGGSIENLRGSIQNAILTIGTVNAPLIKGTADAIGAGMDGFSKLPEWAQQSLSIGGGVALTGASAWGTMALMRRMFGLGPAPAPPITGGVGAGAGAATGAATGAGAAGGGAAAGAGAAKAGGALAVGGVAAGIAIGGVLASAFAKKAVEQDPAAFGSEGGMLGALGGDYALAGAILNAGSPTGGGAPSAPVPVEVRALPAGADKSGQIAAIENTLDRAAAASAAAANGGLPVEAAVRPDQIVAKVDSLPPVTGEAKVEVASRIDVQLRVDEAWISAKIRAEAGNAVARLPLASGGARPGALSMPDAAAPPGAAPKAP